MNAVQLEDDIQEAIDTCPVDCIHWVSHFIEVKYTVVNGNELSIAHVATMELDVASRHLRTSQSMYT